VKKNIEHAMTFIACGVEASGLLEPRSVCNPPLQTRRDWRRGPWLRVQRQKMSGLLQIFTIVAKLPWCSTTWLRGRKCSAKQLLARLRGCGFKQVSKEPEQL